MIEKINKLNWELCDESNYPDDDKKNVTLIVIEDDLGIECWTYDKCPYGWSVLCRRGAYCAEIDLPTIVKKY